MTKTHWTDLKMYGTLNTSTTPNLKGKTVQFVVNKKFLYRIVPPPPSILTWELLHALIVVVLNSTTRWPLLKKTLILDLPNDNLYSLVDNNDECIR